MKRGTILGEYLFQIKPILKPINAQLPWSTKMQVRARSLIAIHALMIKLIKNKALRENWYKEIESV